MHGAIIRYKILKFFQREFAIFFAAAFFSFSAFAYDRALSVRAVAEWDTGSFKTVTELDVAAAGLQMPAVRNTGAERINRELPLLVKEALFALPIDSSMLLGDAVASGIVGADAVTALIDRGVREAAYFSDDLTSLFMSHISSINDIGALFIQHSAPQTAPAATDYRPSRAYTGILIDARGVLPVHGESVSDRLQPCLFPKIWDANMDLLYERNMVKPNIAKERGIVLYGSGNSGDIAAAVGRDPLRITARELFGQNRTDVLISRDDALKILALEANRNLFTEGRVAIICDDDKIVQRDLTPEKGARYYYAYSNIARSIPAALSDDLRVEDNYKGIQIFIHNIRFQPDSADILAEETYRLDVIADSLKAAGADANFLIEGHTASVGKPQGELTLSYERAQRIIEEMVKRGLRRERFSFRGYGGTKPIASNDTPEGRAQNRRVEITVTLPDDSIGW